MPRKSERSEPTLPTPEPPAAAEPEPAAQAGPAAQAEPELEPLLRELTGRVLDALNRNTAAILAAGIMSSRGRPHSPEEAVRLHQEMINTIWPRVPTPPRPAEEGIAA